MIVILIQEPSGKGFDYYPCIKNNRKGYYYYLYVKKVIGKDYYYYSCIKTNRKGLLSLSLSIFSGL